MFPLSLRWHTLTRMVTSWPTINKPPGCKLYMQVETRVSNFYIYAHVNVMQNVSKYSLTKRFFRLTIRIIIIITIIMITIINKVLATLKWPRRFFTFSQIKKKLILKDTPFNNIKSNMVKLSCGVDKSIWIEFISFDK